MGMVAIQRFVTVRDVVDTTKITKKDRLEAQQHRESHAHMRS